MAVTENEGWIHVPGMREWHVRASLHALEHSTETIRKFTLGKFRAVELTVLSRCYAKDT